ncbi:regulator of G-protein signaling 17 isoform X2 [Bombus affinis]|uniref:Regulator of G-protein signaling 17 isoform X4 n=1 Tax=Bombus terrestris TaxID=30195 RepID=A0A9C6SH94_BOMTE|nr:regulator of G-protein signaling 17 isoform X4 [Bombus terrestris]XP_050590335.1 regulator of G-protein signaling 17 isoform X2 [Bombus affinis]
MIEMSSGIGATAMGIDVSHGAGGGEGVAGGCRLRAQSQSQASGSSGNSQQSSQQQQQQQQQQPPSSQQPQQQQQRQSSGIMGRLKKDNCCLCWCWCCSCSCLSALRGNSAGAGGAIDQGKKKGNSGVEHSELCDTGNGLDGLDGLDGNVECSLEEIRSWGSSFDKLMRSDAGRKFFREFLLSEYSEENIAFWLACEQLKHESNSEKIEENARYIYDRYISTVSEKEVSLDSRVREIVNRNMVQPTPNTFDEAQLQIYTLMHRDSYPRFVNSEIYRRASRLSSGTTGSSNQEHGNTAKSKGKRSTT